MSNNYFSPLRYPGGKNSLYDFLVGILEKNNIYDGVYAEGFAGGAGAALKLLALEQVYEIHLNDSDKLIFEFWNSVLNYTDDLCKLIYDTNVNISEWELRKKILKDDALQNELPSAQLGFTSFFLNRCNRSGILKAGVIGGKNQDGYWKIDARYNKKDLINRIQKIASYKERIKIYNLDIIDFLKKLNASKINSNDLLTYLDPPYVIQGKELYRHYFSTQKHIQLANYLQRYYKNKWLVSYDDHELIHNIYKNVSKNIFEFNYYANRTKVGRELTIGSKTCALPSKSLHYQRLKSIDRNIHQIGIIDTVAM